MPDDIQFFVEMGQQHIAHQRHVQELMIDASILPLPGERQTLPGLDSMILYSTEPIHETEITMEESEGKESNA